MRRLLAAGVFAAVLAPVAGTVAADPLPYPPYDTNPAVDEDEPADSPEMVDVIIVDPGEDDAGPAADRLLGDLGVDNDERGCPAPGDYDPRPRCFYVAAALHFALVRLTPDEADEAKELGRLSGMDVQVAFDVSIPRMSSDSEFEATMQRITPNSMGGEPVNSGQVVPTGYMRVGAEPGDYSDVDIAILDTGVDAFNDDLNVVGGFNCTFDDRGEQGWGIDDYGHGTHVAGIAAAIDNDRGVIGPAAGARIWSVPVLSDGSGSMATLACGVDWMAQHVGTVEIANMSLGGTNLPSTCWSWDALHNAFCEAVDMGAIFVVSAGNSEADAINFSPANYGELVTVSALTDYDGLPGGLAAPPDGIPSSYRDDAKAIFSNYGSVVDFIAPGVNILSTLPMNTVGWAHGTSMASPEATGVLAAYIAQCGAEGAVDAVLDYSTQGGWVRVGGAWEGDVGPDHEPLIRFGAGCS